MDSVILRSPVTARVNPVSMLVVAASFFVTQCFSSNPPLDRRQRLPESLVTRLVDQVSLYPLSGSLDITEEDFNRHLHPGKLLMRLDWVVATGLGDPISDLMTQLGSSDRKVAVLHYLKHNKHEVSLVTARMRQIINVPKFITLAYQRHPNEWIIRAAMSPLLRDVAHYVENRQGRCLYDSVPTGLRDPVKYDDIFADVSGISTRPGDAEGVDAYVTGFAPLGTAEPLLDGIFVTVERQSGLVKVEGPGSTIHFLNPRTGCSCIVNERYQSLSLVPTHRTLFAVEDTTAHFWRADSKDPVVIQVPSNTHVGLLGTDFFSLIGYQENPAPVRIMRRQYASCPFDAYSSRSPYARVPGMALHKYRGERQLISQAFKVTTDLSRPLLLEDIEREVVYAPGFERLELPVTAGLGNPIVWEPMRVFKADDGIDIVCDMDVRQKLDTLSREVRAFDGHVESATDLSKHTELYRRNGAIITGVVQDESVELNEQQRIMQQVFKAYRDRDFGHAVTLFGRWQCPWYSVPTVIQTVFSGMLYESFF